MFGKKKIEVIAAIDGANAKPTAAPQRLAPQPSHSSQSNKSRSTCKANSHQSDFPDVPDVLATSGNEKRTSSG